MFKKMQYAILTQYYYISKIKCYTLHAILLILILRLIDKNYYYVK